MLHLIIVKITLLKVDVCSDGFVFLDTFRYLKFKGTQWTLRLFIRTDQPFLRPPTEPTICPRVSIKIKKYNQEKELPVKKRSTALQGPHFFTKDH